MTNAIAAGVFLVEKGYSLHVLIRRSK